MSPLLPLFSVSTFIFSLSPFLPSSSSLPPSLTQLSKWKSLQFLIASLPLSLPSSLFLSTLPSFSLSLPPSFLSCLALSPSLCYLCERDFSFSSQFLSLPSSLPSFPSPHSFPLSLPFALPPPPSPSLSHSVICMKRD